MKIMAIFRSILRQFCQQYWSRIWGPIWAPFQWNVRWPYLPLKTPKTRGKSGFFTKVSFCLQPFVFRFFDGHMTVHNLKELEKSQVSRRKENTRIPSRDFLFCFDGLSLKSQHVSASTQASVYNAARLSAGVKSKQSTKEIRIWLKMLKCSHKSRPLYAQRPICERRSTKVCSKVRAKMTLIPVVIFIVFQVSLLSAPVGFEHQNWRSVNGQS